MKLLDENVTLNASGDLKYLLPFLGHWIKTADKVAAELEKRKHKDKVKWVLFYSFPPDEEWMECFPYPLLTCYIAPNEECGDMVAMVSGRGTFVYDDNINTHFESDFVVKSIVDEILSRKKSV